MSLLMTWRMRQVPPSGANVSPVRRTFWISVAMPDGEGVDPQAGQATPTPGRSHIGSLMMPPTTSSMPE